MSGGEDSWGRSAPHPSDAGEWDSADDPDVFGDPDAPRYTSGNLLGWGGMGRVSAVHDQWLDREVALKVPNERVDPARLAREARITARLEHPGIVPIYDAGTDEQGRPFYAMRLVRGRSLHDAIDETPEEHRLDLLRHFLSACDAVAYAHSQGVIHRDLKPANIMVGEFGETQVVDWGLAVELHEDSNRGSVGTPEYMSPEAAHGEPMDCRSDVFSLGRTLLELLPDGPPAELAAIAAKATAPDRNSRYPTAQELAKDVERWFAGRRVQAHDYSAAEILWRFVRAWRVPLAIGGVALLVVTGVIAAAGASVVRERDEAVAARAETRTALSTADRHRASLLVREARAAQDDHRRAAAEVLAAHALTVSESPDARGVLAAYTGSTRPVLVSREPGVSGCQSTALSESGATLMCTRSQSFELWDLGHPEPRWTQQGEAMRAIASESTGRVLSSQPDGIAIRDAATGEVLQSWSVRTWKMDIGLTADGRHAAVAVSGGAVFVDLEALTLVEVERLCPVAPSAFATGPVPGEWLVACQNATILRGDVDGFEPVVDLPYLETGMPTALYWDSPDRAFIGSLEGQVIWLDLSTGEFVWSRRASGDWVEAILPRDDLLVVSTDAGPLVLHRESGEVLARLPIDHAVWIRPTEGGVEFVGNERTRYELASMRPNRYLHPVGLSSAVLSGDAQLLVLNGGGGQVDVIRTSNGTRKGVLQWQDRVVKPGSFTPDDAAYLAIGMEGPSPCLQRLDPWGPSEFEGPPGIYRRVGVLHDGVRIALDYGSTAHFWRPGETESFARVKGVAGDLYVPPTRAMAIATSAEHGPVILRSDGTLEPLGGDTLSSSVAISDEGQVWAEAVLDQAAIHLGDTTTSIDPEGLILDLAMDGTGERIALALSDGTTEIWSIGGHQKLAVLRGHVGRVSSVGFDASGDWLATGSWDHTARLWNLSELDRPRAEVLQAVEQDWGLTVDDILGLGR